MELFGSIMRPAPRAGATSRGTLGVSFLAHGLIVALVVAVPLAAPIILPAPPGKVVLVVPARPIPPAPPPAPSRPPARAVDLTRSAIPVVAPDRVRDEMPDLFEIGSGAIPPGILCEPAGREPTCPGGGMAGGTGFTPAPPPSAPPAPPPTVRVGGHIRPPEKIHSVSPVYPAIAQQARLEGIVILEAVIAPDGTIRDVRTLRAHPIFEAAALEAVRQWRYRPTLLNGVPVNVIMTVTINFHLD